MRATIRRAASRLLAIFRNDRDEAEFREELEAHLGMREDDLIRRGWTPAQARRQARLDLGSIDGLRDAHRDHRGLPFIDALRRDLRAAVRSIRRDALPAFGVVAILALGVAASTTIFSVLDALLLRPLPFDRPNELVWLANGTSDNLSEQTTQVSNLLDLESGVRSLAGLAGFSPFYGIGDARLTRMGSSERVTVVPITGGFFPLLGVEPLHGRLFTTGESRGTAPAAVLLDHGFWQRRFGGDPSIVGTVITLDDTATAIVGVMPPHFDFAATFAPGSRADLFTPFPLSDANDRRGNTIAVIARLTPGASLEAAEAEAAAVAAQLPSGRLGDRWRNGIEPRLTPLRTRVSGSFTPALTVLGAAAGVLLVLVCANVANLLLVKGAARRREIAVRAALGAGRRQLFRQIFLETLLISGCGVLVGAALGAGAIALLPRIQGAAIPLLVDVRFDVRTLGFTAGLGLAVSLATGLLPAWQASATPPHAVLADGSRGTAGLAGRWRRALVVVEVATVLIMLLTGGLLARSLANVLAVAPGFDPEHLATVRVDPGPAFRALARRTPYFGEIVRSVETLPDVEAAGLTDALPLGNNFGWRRWNARAPERPDVRSEPLVRMIDPGYLGTMRIRVIEGRGFTASDSPSSEPVVIVNQALARSLWPGDSPIGRTLQTAGRTCRVVGVVDEARYFSLERPSGPEMYLPIQQTGDFRVVNLVVRSRRSATDLAPALRAAIARVDPSLPVAEPRTMTALVDDSVFPRRAVAMLVAGFAGFGLLIATIGLYAVVAYSVHQRRPELGIRLALGASPGSLQRGVIADTLRLATVGMAFGLPLAWLASRAVRWLLFGVEPADPVTWVSALLVLTLSAGVAGWLPARRAANVDPVDVLRPV